MAECGYLRSIKYRLGFDVIDLHQRFKLIHPFQDGNGRVGRLVMFKECLANGIVPFIITGGTPQQYEKIPKHRQDRTSYHPAWTR
jgi:fido (protein-threonine AMPylation protein)